MVLYMGVYVCRYVHDNFYICRVNYTIYSREGGNNYNLTCFYAGLKKTLVIKIINVGEQLGGEAGVNISFPEHNSATATNI